MGAFGIRKMIGALSDVRKGTSLSARICLVGSPELLAETGALLSAGALDAAPGGFSASFDVLQRDQLPTRPAALERWSIMVFLEDAQAPLRPELPATVGMCRGAGVSAIVAAVRDTTAVPVDRNRWMVAGDLGSKEFVVHTRGVPAHKAAILRKIAKVAGDDALALAATLPALRPAVVDAIIEHTSRQNAAIGVLIFVPGADMPVMTANQLRMMLKIGVAYGFPPSYDRAVEMVALVATGLGLRTLARRGVRFVPGLGWAFQGVVGYTATQALGRAAVLYFESGAPFTPNRVRRVSERFGKLLGKGSLSGGAVTG